MESLCEQEIKSNAEVLRAIQSDLPIFFDILTSLYTHSALPQEFKGFILYLCDNLKLHLPKHERLKRHLQNTMTPSQGICIFNVTISLSTFEI